jgi:polysaccharide biosynthesis protein PelD
MTTEVETNSGSPAHDTFEFKLHRNALIELAVFLGAAAIVQLSVLDPGTLASLRPHPFWIPVVLISLQYGTMDGIAAVAASIITRWLLGWPLLGADEDYLAYVSRALYEPVLWLGAAIIIGEFRLRQIGENRRLRAQLDELDRQRELLARHVTDTNEHVRRLELRLSASHPHRAVELIDALSILHSSEIYEVRFQIAVATCGKIALGADTLSLFQLSEAALNATVQIRSEGAPVGLSCFHPGDPLFDRIVRDHAVLSILRDQDRDPLGEHGIFAAPICAPCTGKVLGMLKIEHMSPPEVTPAAEHRVVTLCHHLALALDRPGR